MLNISASIEITFSDVTVFAFTHSASTFLATSSFVVISSEYILSTAFDVGPLKSVLVSTSVFPNDFTVIDIPPSYSYTIFITGTLYSTPLTAAVIISHTSSRISAGAFNSTSLYVNPFILLYTSSSPEDVINGLSNVTPSVPPPAVYEFELSIFAVK